MEGNATFHGTGKPLWTCGSSMAMLWIKRLSGLCSLDFRVSQLHVVSL